MRTHLPCLKIMMTMPGSPRADAKASNTTGSMLKEISMTKPRLKKLTSTVWPTRGRNPDYLQASTNHSAVKLDEALVGIRLPE